MKIGTLEFSPLGDNLDIVAEPIRELAQSDHSTTGIYATAIDPTLADTAAFCEEYRIPRSIATNCIVVKAKRADKVWYAACLILADDRVDVNNKVKKYLDARKISFAQQDVALELTRMEYGGVTPIGLPEAVPILIDTNVMNNEHAVVGGGTRASKILVETKVLAALHQAAVINIAQ